jgi:hypothetical protein
MLEAGTLDDITLLQLLSIDSFNVIDPITK